MVELQTNLITSYVLQVKTIINYEHRIELRMKLFVVQKYLIIMPSTTMPQKTIRSRRLPFISIHSKTPR